MAYIVSLPVIFSVDNLEIMIVFPPGLVVWYELMQVKLLAQVQKYIAE